MRPLTAILTYVLPVDYTNPPHIIMQNDNVISINNTTQIDMGQAASGWGHATSAVLVGNCNSCAAPMPQRAASRLFAFLHL